jgi:dihydroflavonol-4-reductase
MLYAITGANGFIACNLIKTLVANGHTVRGTVRDVAKDGAHLTSLGATVAEVKDLMNEEALAKALAGVDGVFHMAAVHPEYGFADTPEGRTSMLATAVEGTVAVLSACQKAGVKRVVLTSSLAAIECGNDEGTLSEVMWSKAEVYDSEEKLKQTQWATHYTYVKSKVEQEKAALAFATKAGLDMRVVVPGNLCIGPIATRENGINGTMTRIRDIMSGKNTLKGAADLAIVHVQDVVDVHCKCMTDDAAKGRYIVAADMAPIADVFAALKEMYPQLPVAEMGVEMDIASGVLGSARKIESRAVTELGLQFKPYRQALKDSIDSMIAANLIAGAAA